MTAHDAARAAAAAAWDEDHIRWYVTTPQIGDPHSGSKQGHTTAVETTEPNVRKLYGPSGEVLITLSDRPPAGFHQGERGRPRR